LSQIKNVITQIRRLLDLDAVPNIINTALLKTGLLQNDLIEGIRIPGIWDTFEAGCRAILGQQISVKAAITMVTNLVNTLGCKQQNNIYFPSPQQLLESDLSFLKMPQSRRSTLLAFAQHCNDNPSESQLDKWLSIKGVGPWTVAYAKMRGQSFPDMWLDTDLIIKKQLLAKQLDAQQAEPWRSYLTLQLWSMA
jgi:AraC family transcriptional regulator of adaptative response / DNA-3-methyladenine glycosylase II